jgi:hypothetical protein
MLCWVGVCMLGVAVISKLDYFQAVVVGTVGGLTQLPGPWSVTGCRATSTLGVNAWDVQRTRSGLARALVVHGRKW